jgi:acyl-CoA ligase (AMP-forming) (exosortase A-associated)
MTPYLVHHLLAASPAPKSHPAIIDGAHSYSYGDLAAGVESLAARLLADGVARGDRVAILLPKCFDECVALFAISRAGGVFVPIHPTLRPEQVAHIVRDCAATAIISTPDLIAPVEGLLSSIPSLRARIVPASVKAQAVPAAQPAAIGEDLAAILYTSGSTGLPKGVMLTHRNLIAGTRIVRTYLGITGRDRILSVLPFSFDYGLNQLLTSVEQGATLALLTFKLGNEIVDALVRHEITGLAGVPTIWAILTRAAPKLQQTRLKHLRYITNSGGAVPTATVKRLRELLPSTRIFLMYGLTEAFRSTYLPPEEIDKRPTSIGKAIPETEIFLVRPDGQPARPGEPGILVHRGPTVSRGYWNRPEETAKVLRPHPFTSVDMGGETVCYSGDLAVADEDGYFYFVGRNDAMIKSAGHRVSPTEVEEALMASGAFRQVAVIGLPDEWVGQKVHAVAIPLDGEVDTRGILGTAATRLAAHMVPGRIELVETLPTTPNGKVDYKRLVAERSQ